MTENIAWGQSGQDVFERTYSRPKADGSMETWPETVKRTVDGNIGLVYGTDEDAWSDDIRAEREELIETITKFWALPGGRHLWASGVLDKNGNSFVSNCFTSGRGEKMSDHHAYLFSRLMEGGGVGYNYSAQGQGWASPSKPLTLHIVCDPTHKDYQDMADAGVLSNAYGDDWVGAYEVADTREGWVDAMADLLDTYARGDVKHANRVYDVSHIRPRGSRLKSFGGSASGPLPFAQMMTDVAAIMNGAVGGETLRTLDLMRIDHAIACAVVAGGVRRSARMSIVHWNDPQVFEFIASKTGVHALWTTNISVDVDAAFFKGLDDGDEHATRVLQALAEGMVLNGEPGIINLEEANRTSPVKVVSSNPCFPSDAKLMTEAGWITFGDAFKSGEPQRIAVDGRVSYKPSADGVEHPDNWIVQRKGYEPVIMDASHVFLTQHDADIVKVSLSNGMSVRCTPDHHIATANRGMVEAGDLMGGDTVLITRGAYPSEPLRRPESLEEMEATLMGLIAGDGHIRADGYVKIELWGDKKSILADVVSWIEALFETYGSLYPSAGNRPRISHGVGHLPERDMLTVRSSFLALHLDAKYGFNKETKHSVPAQFVEGARTMAARLYVSALAFCDGTVNKYNKVGSSSARIGQSNREMLADIQLICLANGVDSSLYSRRKAGAHMMPDGKGGSREYQAKEYFELVFMARAFEYAKYFGFLWGTKQDGADILTPSRNRSAITRVVTVVPDGKGDVYCLRENVRRILCANGVTARRCAEQIMGEFDACNLANVNLAKCPPHLLERVHVLMTRFLVRGTFAGFADERTAATVAKNRRIGLGHFGVQGHLAKLGIKWSEAPHTTFPLRLKHWYEVTREAARQYAYELRIPEPVQVTDVAPVGSTAKLSGDTEGIHPIFGRYFERRIRFSMNDARQMDRVNELFAQGFAVEQDVYADDTVVVVYPTKDSLVAEVELLGHSENIVESAIEISLRQQVEFLSMYQTSWADNAVSFTASIPEGLDPAIVSDVIREFGPRLKGMTVFPDASRPQSPYTRITAEQYAAAAATLVADGVDENCATGACPVR